MDERLLIHVRQTPLEISNQCSLFVRRTAGGRVRGVSSHRRMKRTVGAQFPPPRQLLAGCGS
eukprot:3610770-Prorocentrum_lima.AAC.1